MMDEYKYEHYVADYLKTHGFYGVKVTKESGDYGVDVIAHKNGCKYAVQCKYYSNSVGVSAIQEVTAGKAFYHCDKALVVTNSSFTQPAKNLAKANNVVLLEYISPKKEFSSMSVKQHKTIIKIVLCGVYFFLASAFLKATIDAAKVVSQARFAYNMVSTLIVLLCPVVLVVIFWLSTNSVVFRKHLPYIVYGTNKIGECFQSSGGIDNNLECSEITGLPYKFKIFEKSYSIENIEDIKSMPITYLHNPFIINGKKFYPNNYFRMCAKIYRESGCSEIADALLSKAAYLEINSPFAKRLRRKMRLVIKVPKSKKALSEELFNNSEPELLDISNVLDEPKSAESSVGEDKVKEELFEFAETELNDNNIEFVKNDYFGMDLAKTEYIFPPVDCLYESESIEGNDTTQIVPLREIITSEEFKSIKSNIKIGLGKNHIGNVVCFDIEKIPNLLISGITGSGKSVCLNCIIISLLYSTKPSDVKLIIIDFKQVDFLVYNGISNLLVPIITDVKNAINSLEWIVKEIENRYNSFLNFGVRDINGFNKYVLSHPEQQYMPKIVVIIDGLNELIIESPQKVEMTINKITQKGRAAGIYLIVSIQHLSLNATSRILIDNFPNRISFRTSSKEDSKAVLYTAGAERLQMNGDMLFLTVGITKPMRIQASYISYEEIQNVISFIKKEEKVSQALISEENDNYDMINSAKDVVAECQVVSTTLLQRKLRLGYTKAARIMDELERLKIVGPPDENKERKVLISQSQLAGIKAAIDNSELVN